MLKTIQCKIQNFCKSKSEDDHNVEGSANKANDEDEGLEKEDVEDSILYA